MQTPQEYFRHPIGVVWNTSAVDEVRWSNPETACEYCPTGNSILDECLGGGLLKGSVTEVFGAAGCGKTQLLLQAAVHVATTGHSAIYIASEDLPIQRLNQLTTAFASSTNMSELDILQNILISRIHHIEHMASLLSQTSCENACLSGKIGLVIVDSITACCSEQGDASLAASTLKLFAMRNKVAVLVANQVRSHFGGHGSFDTIPALGLQWSQGVHTRLAVTRFGEKRTMRSVFSSHLPPIHIEFTIDSTGVHFSSFPQ